MRDYYVTLTGSRGNAGDDLIRYSAFKLFEEFRKDRDVKDLSAWEELDDEKLTLVNNGRALILLGGPALRYDTYPRVYPLRKNLDDIKVPIIILGVGYRDQNGEWRNTSNFYLSEKTKLLLDKVEASGYKSSVRDFHTLNVLLHKGYKNFLMSGCPAMYNTEFIGHPFLEYPITKIGFAPGRMYIRSKSIFEQQIKIINDLKKSYPEQKLTVAFHDPIDLRIQPTKDFIKTLEQYQIPFVDISGNANNLIKFYTEQDLQIGYRVHAHIFMSSINKASILLNEDGRGKGMKTVLGGLILDAYNLKKLGFISRLKIKTGLSHINNLVEGEKNLLQDIVKNLTYEMENSYPRISRSRQSIDLYFPSMKKILSALP